MTQMVALLTGETDGAVEVRNGAVQVNLAAVINAVKQRLEDRGLSIVSRLPEINAEFTVFQSKDITRAQTAFRLLDNVSTWLPWLAVALFVAGVAVARSRRKALVVGGLAVAFSMIALGLRPQRVPRGLPRPGAGRPAAHRRRGLAVRRGRLLHPAQPARGAGAVPRRGRDGLGDRPGCGTDRRTTWRDAGRGRPAARRGEHRARHRAVR